MRMLNDSVLVLLQEEEDTGVSEGGIILTSKADDDRSSKPATVIAVGAHVSDIKPDDVVYLTWNNSIPITVEGMKLNIVPAEDIKAIL